MTPPTNKALLRNMEILHDAAERGDSAAASTIHGLRAKAYAGDLTALAAVNTYKILGFQKQDPAAWTEAGIMHQRLVHGDPHAEAWLNAVTTSAVAGVEKASTTLDMLAAHTDKHYASAWARPDDGEPADNTRTRNVNFMTPAMPRRRRAYAVGNLVIGADPTPTKKFLKLTPSAEQQLIRMMLLGAQAHPTGDNVAHAVSHAALANVSARSLSEAPICARARDAVARNSPAASALVAQCNAASGRQVLAPVAAPAAAAPGSPRSLGRIMMKPAVALGRIQAPSTLRPEDLAIQGICSRAADAKARNSPIYPRLLAACVQARTNNIRNGLFIADQLTPDMTSEASNALRAALDAAGGAVVNGNPKMQAFRASLPSSDQQRGFTMAMGVRAGKVDPKFVAFITPGLTGTPDVLKGFLDAMNM